MQNISKTKTISKPVIKKERIGRWTASESYLFESLLEKYGKSWKKIHEHMKGRSLSQIRSHGQKYFDKIGPKKVDQLTRRAKLIQAYQTLEKEKHMHEEASSYSSVYTKQQPQIIKEQESPFTLEEEDLHIKLEADVAPDNKPSEIVKEQAKQGQIIKDQNLENKESEGVRYFFNQFDGGLLVNLIRMYPESFAAYGIAGLVDNAQFRNGSHVFL